eukprot:8540330-Pyramimonas_sp.AAC.2
MVLRALAYNVEWAGHARLEEISTPRADSRHPDAQRHRASRNEGRGRGADELAEPHVCPVWVPKFKMVKPFARPGGAVQR